MSVASQRFMPVWWVLKELKGIVGFSGVSSHHSALLVFFFAGERDGPDRLVVRPKSVAHLTHTLVPSVPASLSLILAGSRATKHKASLKAKLEEPDAVPNTFSSADAPAVKATLTGSRSAFQVVCNGLVGVVACAAWIYQFGSNYPVGGFAMADGVKHYLPGGPYDIKTSCPLAIAVGVKAQEQRMSNALIFCAVG